MIEAPENVYPHNTAVYIDKTTEQGEFVNPVRASFIFNGDNLSFMRAEVYLADTNAVMYHSVIPATRVPWDGKYRRGDVVSYDMNVASEHCENGKDYTYRYILFEQNEDQTPKCEMKCLSGRITSAAGTSIVVEKNITDIDEPYTEQNYLIGCCMIKLYGRDNDGKKTILNFIMIENYDSSTGEITLADDLDGDFAPGDRYEIYRNYYKTPMYFFKARENAHLAPTADINEMYGTPFCKAIYTTNGDISLMYYNWILKNIDDIIIDSSRDVYSYHTKEGFPSHDFTQNNLTLNHDFPYLCSLPMKLTCNVVSQDGVTASEEITLSPVVSVTDDLTGYVQPFTGRAVNDGYLLKYDNGLAIDLERRCVKVRFARASGTERYTLFRRSITHGEEMYRFVKTVSSSQDSVVMYDRNVNEGEEYEYLLYSGNNIAYVLGAITPEFLPSCVITGLNEYSREYFGKSVYSDGEFWHLDFDVEDPELLIHTKKQVSSTSGYPYSTSNGEPYISAVFSAAITQFDVTGFYGELTEGAGLTAAFGQFINKYNAFLLQLPGTPTMIVGIDSDIKLKKNAAGLTVCSFSFSEICSADQTFIR